MSKKEEQDRRTWLYKKDQEPRIFEDEKAVKDAMEAGWVDSPDKVDESDDQKSENKKIGKKGKLDAGKVDGGQDQEPTGEGLEGV